MGVHEEPRRHSVGTSRHSSVEGWTETRTMGLLGGRLRSKGKSRRVYWCSQGVPGSLWARGVTPDTVHGHVWGRCRGCVTTVRRDRVERKRIRLSRNSCPSTVYM